MYDLSYYITVLFIVMVFFFGACTSDKPASESPKNIAESVEAVQEIEDRFMDLVNNNPGSPELNVVMLRLVEQYRIFTDQHPDHQEAPEMLFRAANLRADGLKEYQSAINMFNRIRREYPESKQAERSLFLIGYTQSEFLKDFDAARVSYEAFLEQYPDSDLAPSVEAEIQFLGKDIDEILRQFELEE